MTVCCVLFVRCRVAELLYTTLPADHGGEERLAGAPAHNVDGCAAEALLCLCWSESAHADARTSIVMLGWVCSVGVARS